MVRCVEAGFAALLESHLVGHARCECHRAQLGRVPSGPCRLTLIQLLYQAGRRCAVRVEFQEQRVTAEVPDHGPPAEKPFGADNRVAHLAAVVAGPAFLMILELHRQVVLFQIEEGVELEDRLRGRHVPCGQLFGA